MLNNFKKTSKPCISLLSQSLLSGQLKALQHCLPASKLPGEKQFEVVSNQFTGILTQVAAQNILPLCHWRSSQLWSPSLQMKRWLINSSIHLWVTEVAPCPHMFMLGSLEQCLGVEKWPWNVLGDVSFPSGGNAREVSPQECWCMLTETTIWLYEWNANCWALYETVWTPLQHKCVPPSCALGHSYLKTKWLEYKTWLGFLPIFLLVFHKGRRKSRNHT